MAVRCRLCAITVALRRYNQPSCVLACRHGIVGKCYFDNTKNQLTYFALEVISAHVINLSASLPVAVTVSRLFLSTCEVAVRVASMQASAYKAAITIAIRLRYDDTTTRSTTTEVIEIAIRLRYNYDKTTTKIHGGP